MSVCFDATETPVVRFGVPCCCLDCCCGSAGLRQPMPGAGRAAAGATAVVAAVAAVAVVTAVAAVAVVVASC